MISLQNRIDQDATAESDTDQSVPALSDSVEDQDSAQVVTIVDTSIQELLDGILDQDQTGAETIVDASIQESPEEEADQDRSGQKQLLSNRYRSCLMQLKIRN